MSETPNDDPSPLQNPILSWGEPVGTYQIELMNGFGVFRYKAPNGQAVMAFPMSNQAIGEMKALIDMLVFDAEVIERIKIPPGRIAAMGNA